MKPYGLPEKKSQVYPLGITAKNKKTVRQFAKKLIEGQRSLDPEIAKIVNDRFWDML